MDEYKLFGNEGITRRFRSHAHKTRFSVSVLKQKSFEPERIPSLSNNNNNNNMMEKSGEIEFYGCGYGHS